MIVLLDNGHGGLVNGQYQTSGKRSPLWNDGSQLFEGEFSRAIVSRIVESLTKIKIPYVLIAPEARDVMLSTRVSRANKYSEEACFYLSIHSNAGGGNGFDVFTSHGESKSDEIATIFGEEFKAKYPEKKLRTDFSDGDLDKERRFIVLRDTFMAAVLTENFFMDNEEEYRDILLNKNGRDLIAQLHVDVIQRVEKEIF